MVRRQTSDCHALGRLFRQARDSWELGAGSVSHGGKDVRHQTIRRQTFARLSHFIELMAVSCFPCNRGSDLLRRLRMECIMQVRM